MQQPNTGKLRVQTSTADGTVVINDVLVSVFDATGALVAQGRTHESGSTEDFIIASPPLAYSFVPGGQTPFSKIRIVVEKEGFNTIEFINAEIYPGIITIQRANLQPTPYYEGFPIDYSRSSIVDEGGGPAL